MTEEKIKEFSEEMSKQGFTIIKNSETHKEEIIKALSELPIHKEFEPVPGLAIPLSDSVIIYPIEQDTFKSRNSGLQVIDSAKNRIGIVYAIGPDCRLPIHLGMTILFEPKANYLDIIGPDGKLYIYMLIHNVYCAIPPDNYILPMKGMIKDKLQIRNDERREGVLKSNKASVDKLQESNEKKEHKTKNISIPKQWKASK